MLEQETDRILSTVVERTIGGRESVTLKEIIGADIPRGVKIYARTEVLHWLMNDLLEAPRFSRVNRSAPGVSQLIDPFLRSLCNAYEFTRAECSSILSDGVHFCANYLCRPQWTLEAFVYDRSTRIPTSALLAKLEYAGEYTYFSRLIEKLVRQWDMHEVPRDEFRAMVSKIDNQVVRQHSAQELGLLLKPIYDFLLVGSESRNSAIPLAPILVFLEDKQLTALRDHVESTCGIRGRSELTMREFTAIIEDIYLKQSISTEEVRPAAGDTYGAADVTSRFPVLPREAPSPGPVAAEESPPAAPPEPAAAEEPPPTAIPEPDASTPETPPVPPPEKPAAPPPAAPPRKGPRLPDLNTIITAKQRNRVIRKLFRKDQERYAAAIAELNRMESWKEASHFLYELFRTNQLDPYSGDVIEFTDLVQTRYPAVDR